MIIYLILILLILVLGHFFYKKSLKKIDLNSNRKQYIIVVCLLLIIQSGFRNIAVGSDTFAYYESFERSKKLSWTQAEKDFIDYYKFDIGKDLGYSFFEKGVQILIDDYQLYLVVIAILFFSSLGFFIYDNSRNIKSDILAFLLYYVIFYRVFPETATRQAIALAVTMYSFSYIKRQKLFPFIILILLVSTIHKSVLIFLPFYFFVKIPKIKTFFVILLLLFPIFLNFKKVLATYFLSSTTSYDNYEEFEGSGTYVFTVLFLLISFFGLLKYKLLMKQNGNNKYLFFAFSLVLFLLPLSYVHPALLRITMYFSVFILFFVPEIIETFSSVSVKFKNDIYRLVVIVLIILFIKSNWEAPPYGFFWEEMRLGRNYFEE